MAGERKFVTEKIRRVLLKEYFMKETKRAGFGGLDIQRTPMGTRVTLMTERPGLVIGRRGDTIRKLTDAVEFKFKFDKPQIEVVEVDNPNLNAQIMAEKLAAALERGWHFRRAGHSTVRRIMSAGARGCQIIISGKLTGQRHRMEKFKEGHIKFCGEPKLQWMREGFSAAKLKQGVIGVKVQIMSPNARLPDEVEILATADDVPPAPKPYIEPDASAPDGEPEGPVTEPAVVGEEPQPPSEEKPKKEKSTKKKKAASEKKKAEKAEKAPEPEPEEKPKPKNSSKKKADTKPSEEKSESEEPRSEPAPEKEQAGEAKEKVEESEKAKDEKEGEDVTS